MRLIHRHVLLLVLQILRHLRGSRLAAWRSAIGANLEARSKTRKREPQRLSTSAYISMGLSKKLNTSSRFGARTVATDKTGSQTFNLARTNGEHYPRGYMVITVRLER